MKYSSFLFFIFMKELKNDLLINIKQLYGYFHKYSLHVIQK